MAVIGSAYVNIRAITDKLESDIRDAVNKIQDTISLTVNADTTAATAQIQELVETTAERIEVEVDADTTAATERIAAVAGSDVTINVDADTTAATERISAVSGREIEIDVQANTGIAETELTSFATRMSTLRASIFATANTIAARISMAILTRPRTATVYVNTNEASLARAKSSLASIGTSVAALSGGRVLGDRITKMVDNFARLDRSVPGLSRMSLIFGTIASLVLNATAGLLTFGAALGSIINMTGLVAPGMIAGFAMGIGVLIVALTDFKTQLPDVVEQYKTLGQAIKVPFWDIAREPIRDMANTLFPSLKSGIESTAVSLGRWTAELAESIKVSFTADRLGQMFKFLTDSIDIASEATSKNVQTLSTLGLAGGSVLPRLAGWWVDVSTKFNTFIETAAADGRLDQWINDGIQNLKELGSAIGNAGGIFANLTEAARLAGSDGLTNLNEGLAVFREITGDAGVQANLANIFRGAGVAADGFVEALARVFGGIGDMSPAIEAAFGSVGQMLIQLGTAIQGIFQNDQFQAGFVAMFAGFQAGFEALMPVLATTGPKFGEIGQIIGLLAENIGGVLAAALQVALPFLVALGEAVRPLIEIYGNTLISIIQSLAPTFDVLTKTITDLSPAITAVVSVVASLVAGLVDTLGPALPGIIVGIAAFAATMQIVSVVTAVSKGITLLTASIAAYRAGLTIATANQVGLNLAMLANPVGLVIAAVVGLVAVIVLAYNNIGWFKDFVDGAFKLIGDIIKNTVTWIGDNWKMLLGFLTGPIGAAVIFITSNWDTISAVFTAFVDNTVGMFKDFFSNTMGMFSDFFGGIGGFFSDMGEKFGLAFSALSGIVSQHLEAVVAVIRVVVDAAIQVWQNGWQLISDVFTTIWTNLANFFAPLVELITAIIKGAVDIIIALWQVGWDIISTIFIGVWTNLVLFFTPIIQQIQDTITLGIETAKLAWEMTWQAISDFFVTIWNNIIAFIIPIVQSVSDTITLVVETTKLLWEIAWQAISDFFVNIWNNIVAFVTPILLTIQTGITTVVEATRILWNTAWQAISDFFANIWNNIVAFISPIMASIQSTIKTGIDTVSTTWTNIWNGISTFFTNTWNTIVNNINGFVSTIKTKVSEAAGFFTSLPSDILAKVSGFGTLLYSAGSDLITGLANGITDMTGWVVSKVRNVGVSVVDSLKSFFGIQSPSKLMREQIGMMIGKGLAQGIEQSVGLVEDATGRLMEAATPTLPSLTLGATTKPALSLPARLDNVPSRSNGRNSGLSSYASEAGINVTINPSADLDEEKIGLVAANEILWQIQNR